MITEDYVSFETAKLLKEKGFDEPCWGYYVKQHIDHYFKPVTNSEWTSDKYSAPTLQMTMKWLRENHKFHFEIIRSEGFYFCHIQNADNGSPIAGVVPFASTYEEAVEDGIQYCLKNLI